MKYIITKTLKYEIEANSKEEAEEMTKTEKPVLNIDIKEIKPIADYNDLLEKMTGIRDVTCNKVQAVLDKIKSELSPRINVLYNLLCQAKQNGLRVNRYLHYPDRIYTFGLSGNSLIFKLDDNKYYYIDYKGDVYNSNYACGYENGKTIFSETFRVTKGSPSNEEINNSKLIYLKDLVDRFNQFETDLLKDINNQITYKINNK